MSYSIVCRGCGSVSQSGRVDPDDGRWYSVCVYIYIYIYICVYIYIYICIIHDYIIINSHMIITTTTTTTIIIIIIIGIIIMMAGGTAAAAGRIGRPNLYAGLYSWLGILSRSMFPVQEQPPGLYSWLGAFPWSLFLDLDSCRQAAAIDYDIHPVSVRRFPSFRTQPLENPSHYL